MNSIFSLMLKSVRNGQSDIKKKKKAINKFIMTGWFSFTSNQVYGTAEEKKKEIQKRMY